MHLLHFGVLKKKTLVHATAVTHSFSFGWEGGLLRLFLSLCLCLNTASCLNTAYAWKLLLCVERSWSMWLQHCNSLCQSPACRLLHIKLSPHNRRGFVLRFLQQMWSVEVTCPLGMNVMWVQFFCLGILLKYQQVNYVCNILHIKQHCRVWSGIEPSIITGYTCCVIAYSVKKFHSRI
jgi:hypothetical protein